MKKIIIFIICISQAISPSQAQSGKNCFNTEFNRDATSLDATNAYLLAYLSTMAYPDYLRFHFPGVRGYGHSGDSVKFLQANNNKFVQYYSNKLGYLFVDRDQAPKSTFAAGDDPSIRNMGGLATPARPSSPSEPNVAIYRVPNGQTARFDFQHTCNPNGYNPEAIIISTPATIFVVFRGTDRVNCNDAGTFAYEWGEWIASDFKFLKREASIMNAGIKGNVHRGMVESLMLDHFADSLSARIKRYGGERKKVWITGHSLGGAHAQLFSMYLKFNYGIKPQGVYIFQSPHPGDDVFVNQLNEEIGKKRIQRFEFGDDPVAMLPPQSFAFARAGERNYFKDYTSTNLRTEQKPEEDIKVLCALGNLPANVIPAMARFVFPPYCPASFCYHHPTFILKAVRHMLNSSELPALPSDLPMPKAGDFCTTGDLTKAENNDLINNTATAVEASLEPIVWQASNIVSNLLGSGLTEGKYRLVNYGLKGRTKKYLNWNGQLFSQLNMSSSGTIFNINYKELSACQGAGGYQFFSGATNMSADVKFTMGIPTGQELSSRILMKPKDNCIGDEETWYLFAVPGKANTFVLYNWNSKKVLEAPDCKTSSNSCPVVEATPNSNRSTQVWVLEKVN